ncbi:SixA phosphatase family protein [Naumannella halotolerans]|uniref:SixA phosphatase family protein n=1 Tax=Naumannella halotolerans TaxID=993414 RepID=UPI00370DB3A8
MRSLYLLRHAKAADFTPGGLDHERPLTERGRLQAAEVGQALADPGLPRIDQVLCSTATRTRQTLAGLATAGLEPDCPVTFSDAIYGASPEELLAEIATADGDALLVVGHSPGIPGLVLELADADSDPALLGSVGSRYPPASLSLLRADTGWTDLTSATLSHVRLGS